MAGPRRGAGAAPPPGWAPCRAACAHPRPVPVAVGSVLSSYGWYMLLAVVAVYLLVQKVSRSLAARLSARPGAAEAAEGEYGARCGVGAWPGG